MLTERKINELKPKDRAYRILDSNKLSLQVNKNGRKYWRYCYRIGNNSQSRTISLGNHPTVSLKEARKHRDLCSLIVRQGRNPLRSEWRKKLITLPLPKVKEKNKNLPWAVVAVILAIAYLIAIILAVR